MAQVDWRLQGVEFGACNCDWGCPCQFNVRPTSGHCTGGLVMKIEQGYFGSTPLTGLVWGLFGEWPGAIHEGNGRLLVFGEERATPAQRQALLEIAHGRQSAEGTLFHILSAMCPTKLEPVFAPIDFHVDPEKLTARARIADLFDMTGEPIRNPVTGEPHFPVLSLRNGFEFKQAQFASGTVKSSGPIRLDRDQGHAHFASVHWGPQGYID